MADHVDIGGLTFCVPAHGVAIRVEVTTLTYLIDVTDLIVRAAWEQGGAYDAGLPWFTPTANPCELDLDVGSDDRWDPTTAAAYDLIPLATTVRITLAEQATFGTWSTQHRFFGPLLAHTYEPQPAGGARVKITAADALTNLGDMIADERPEETPYDRLNYLASGVPNLDWGFSALNLDTPLLGRYHPDQALTRLELMIDSALAGGCALMFQPTATDAAIPLKTIVYDALQGRFSDIGVAFTAAVDPENGMVLTNGDVPFTGTDLVVKPACLTALELARTDAGFRTRIRAGRTIAPWTIAVNQPGPGAVPTGNHFWQSPVFYAQPGDRLQLTVAGGEPVSWTGGDPVYRSVAFTPLAGGEVQKDSPPAGVNSSAPDVQFGYTPLDLTGSYALGRYIMVPSGQFNYGLSFTETAARAEGTGPELEAVDPLREEWYGQRAVAGFKSPILVQADLSAWMWRALGWVTAPSYHPQILTVATTAAHRSPGAQQWAVQLYAGQRLALRHYEVPAQPDAATINAWVVNMSTTFTPTEVTIDVECGPLTSGVA